MCYRVWKPSNVIAFNPIKIRLKKGKPHCRYNCVGRLGCSWAGCGATLDWPGKEVRKGLYCYDIHTIQKQTIVLIGRVSGLTLTSGREGQG